MAEQNMKKAVALRYDPSQDSAPVVVAVGKGAQADAILAVARRNDIPVREDRLLVSVLSKLNIDQEIPPQLYAAVAAILSFLQRHGQRPA